MILVVDNGPCHASKATHHVLAERADWRAVIPLARYSPHLTPKEHEWRLLKRDHRGHLAPSLRAFVDAAVAGLDTLGRRPAGAAGQRADRGRDNLRDRLSPPDGSDGGATGGTSCVTQPADAVSVNSQVITRGAIFRQAGLSRSRSKPPAHH